MWKEWEYVEKGDEKQRIKRGLGQRSQTQIAPWPNEDF